MVMFEGGKAKPLKQPRVEKSENEEEEEEEIFSLENYDVEEDSQALDEQNDFQMILGNEGNSYSPTSKKRRMAIRGRGFSSYEDELICKCWLNISQDTSSAGNNNVHQKENRVNVNVLQDASAGNNNLQRENRFYDRMRDVYNQGLEQTKHRSSKSIKQRWGVINKAVSKFCGYLSQIESRNQNEGVFQDMYDEARRMYSHYEEKNRSFAFELCWKILHGSPKWNEYRDSLGGAAAFITMPVVDVDLEGGGKAKEIPSTGHKELESCREQVIDSAKFEVMNSQQAELMYSVDVVDSMADNSKAKEVRSNGHKKLESSRKQATDNAKFEARGSQQMELMKLVKDMCERNKELYERWMSSMNRMEEQKVKDRQEKAIERAQRNSLAAKQLEMITMQCEMLRNAEQERLRREEERVLSIPLSNMDEFERQYYENRKREIVARSSRSQAP